MKKKPPECKNEDDEGTFWPEKQPSQERFTQKLDTAQVCDGT
jgi:hypothetical protein